jgi:hypothetical protein
VRHLGGGAYPLVHRLHPDRQEDGAHKAQEPVLAIFLRVGALLRRLP